MHIQTHFPTAQLKYLQLPLRDSSLLQWRPSIWLWWLVKQLSLAAWFPISKTFFSNSPLIAIKEIYKKSYNTTAIQRRFYRLPGKRLRTKCSVAQRAQSWSGGLPDRKELMAYFHMWLKLWSMDHVHSSTVWGVWENTQDQEAYTEYLFLNLIEVRQPLWK